MSARAGPRTRASAASCCCAATVVVAGGGRLATGPHEPLEPDGVDVVGADGEHVARAPALDRVPAEQPAQAEIWAWRELAGLATGSSAQISSMSFSCDTGWGAPRASRATMALSLGPDMATGASDAVTSTPPRRHTSIRPATAGA